MIRTIKTYSLTISLLILILITSSCVGGNSKIGTAGDPYIQAQTSKLISPLGSFSATNNNDVPNIDAYSFHREYCYGGDIISYNNTSYCVFKDTTGNEIRVNKNQITTNPKSGSGAVYTINPVQVAKVGAQVFVLNSDKKLMICSLGGNCKNADGAYSDMLAIDCTEEISGTTVTCETDKANYRSVLLLAEPTISKAQTPGAYKLSSQFLQLFINNASDLGANVWNSDNGDKGYIIKRSDIKSDVPLAEVLESNVSRADLINYSFGTVENKFFNLQLIYGRHQNKGTAYQNYYAGFKYGANLINESASTNTSPIRTKDHITVFTPVAQAPLFKDGEVYEKMKQDLRRVAGGSQDVGDNYEWCSGLNTYCLLGDRYGYANIGGDYTSDVIDNAVFLGLMHVSDAALGKLSSIRKIPGENFVSQFGRGFGKYMIPLIGKSATILVLQMYGMQLHNIFFDLTTENQNKNLPTLTPAVNEILNLPQKEHQECAEGSGGHLYCHSEWSISDCEKELITQLTNIELILKKNPDNIYNNSKTLDDLFMSTKACTDKLDSIPWETRERMKSIQIDKLNNFKSSTVSLVYQKLFIESDNINKQTIDLPDDDLSDFVSESDSEQPVADISLRIPNCTGGACDATYFADIEGNWLKDKNGKYISAINGTFINVYYMRTDTNFRPPLLWRIQDGVLPPNLTYSITAYQLSDLSCDEFNKKMTKITGTTNLAAYAALHDRDSWSLILDKTGNTCNFPVKDYGTMVHRYDSSLVGDIFMALPLSTDPATLLIMYGLNFLIGTIDEINRINDINAYDYPIRNAHINSQASTEFDCTDLHVTLNANGKENLQQISASHLPEGGMWIIGDNGLRYIDNYDKQKYTFTYDRSGSGVANSYNGKLLISTSSASTIDIDRYDENKIFEYTNKVLHLAPNTPDFSINISNVKDPLLKEGSYPSTTDFGGNARYVKLYTNQQNQLFGNYTRSEKGNSRPTDTTNLYSWDINTWEKQGWITHNDEKEIDNFIITANGSLNWISKYANTVGWNSMSSVGANPNEVIFNIDPEHPHIWDNPLVFSILNHIFVLTDTGDIFSISDYKESTKKVTVNDMGKTNEVSTLQKFPTQIGKSGIGLYEPITDIVGLEDGRFYLLSSKKVYRCKMPANYLGIENKPLLLNIINKTDNLRSVSLNAMNIDNKYTIKPGYIASNGEHEIDFRPQENQTIRIQKNNIRAEDFVFNDDLYFVGQYQLDSLSINATGSQNGDFKVEMNSRFAPKIFKLTTEKVSDNEYNIIVEKNGEDVPPPRDYHYSTQGEIAEIQTDSNNNKILQSVHENFNYKNYNNSVYSDTSKKIIVNGELYWMGLSVCSSNNTLLMIYYDIPGNTHRYMLKDIAAIKSVDGTTIDAKTFCASK